MADPMKIRAQLKGDVADVKILIFHPMETGLRKDGVTGKLVPILHSGSHRHA
jgi:sulfur-oxidizing protein SoxZ